MGSDSDHGDKTETPAAVEGGAKQNFNYKPWDDILPCCIYPAVSPWPMCVCHLGPSCCGLGACCAGCCDGCPPSCCWARCPCLKCHLGYCPCSLACCYECRCLGLCCDPNPCPLECCKTCCGIKCCLDCWNKCQPCLDCNPKCMVDCCTCKLCCDICKPGLCPLECCTKCMNMCKPMGLQAGCFCHLTCTCCPSCCPEIGPCKNETVEREYIDQCAGPKKEESDKEDAPGQN